MHCSLDNGCRSQAKYWWKLPLENKIHSFRWLRMLVVISVFHSAIMEMISLSFMLVINVFLFKEMEYWRTVLLKPIHWLNTHLFSFSKLWMKINFAFIFVRNSWNCPKIFNFECFLSFCNWRVCNYSRFNHFTIIDFFTNMILVHWKK